MLPPARFFPENGHVVMRSDWTPGATYALFRCGRYGEIDGAGAATMPTTCTSSSTGGASSRPTPGPCIRSTMRPWASPAPRSTATACRTFKSTPGRRSRTIRSPWAATRWNCGAGGMPFWGPFAAAGSRPSRTNRGGRPGDWRSRSPAAGRSNKGRLWPTRHRPGSTTRPAMPRTPTRPRVRSITRQFVYLRPETFVVFDRVVNAEAGLETKWLLHALYEPACDGQKAPDLSLPPPQQLVLAPDGTSTVPNPQPGGRFLHTGGSLLTIDDRWPGMSGRLFVKVLLPRMSSACCGPSAGGGTSSRWKASTMVPRKRPTGSMRRGARPMTARTASAWEAGESSFRPRIGRDGTLPDRLADRRASTAAMAPSSGSRLGPGRRRVTVARPCARSLSPPRDQLAGGSEFAGG